MAAATTNKVGVKAPSLGELEDLSPKKSDKPEKAEKVIKTAEPFEITEKKSGGTLKVALLVSLVWLVLISAVVLLILYDPTEYKDIRNAALLFLNPEEEALDEYYYDQVPTLLEWERELEEFEAELDVYEAELDTRSDEIDERESIVSDREDEADFLLEELGFMENGSVAVDLSAVAKTLAAMDPVRVAASFAELDSELVAKYISLMSTKAAAPILDAMEPELVAELEEIWATPPIELE